MRYIARLSVWLVFLLYTQAAFSQASRIRYNNQDLFLNGSNIAWVNFAHDLGPNPLDTVSFRTVFDSISAHGGNSLRLWLHTDGTQTPQFDATRKVTGPGLYAIADLQKILDIAWQKKIGLLLCLWSFDMQRATIDTGSLARNKLMLTDTSYTRAYIDNSLIPMVSAVRNHPAIIAWEVFNEAEGMTTQFGWSGINRVSIVDIQRFINLTAGAIHRVDSSAKVTTGSWALIVQTDVQPLAKKVSLQAQLNSMTALEKQQIEDKFNAHYQLKMTAEEILAPLITTSNYNYYRDDRLKAIGGDSLGTLDFYTDHYYDWQGTSISPFHHPCSAWGLTKPLVIAEFYPEDLVLSGHPTIPYSNLYSTLFNNGYAGAMSWGWYSGGPAQSQATLQTNTLQLIQDIFTQHPADVTIVYPSGTITYFLANPTVIEKGQSSLLSWTTASGSVVTLNGISVQSNDTLTISPDTTMTYKLVARGDVVDSVEITIKVLLSGTIVFFKANPVEISIGDSSLLSWHTVVGSSVTLNGVPVAQSDTIKVKPVADSTFKLIATGQVTDTGLVTIYVVNPLSINRALNQSIVASSGEIINNVPTAAANPALAVDGNLATRWSSAWSDSEWIYVDLTQGLDIRRVVLVWETAYGKAYNIEVSNDAQNWTQIFSTSSSDGGMDDITGLSASGRYVRMFGLTRATQWGFSLWEFEVYGIPIPSGIADKQAWQIPATFQLEQNYPNPFNPSTTIRYSLPVAGLIKLIVYDILGRQVATLIDKRQNAGVYNLPFNASAVPSGVYFYRITSGTFTQAKKMVILK